MAAGQGLIDFLDLIDDIGLSAPAFGMAQLDDVLSWCGPIDPLLHARLLSALVSAGPGAETIAACANAIAALDGWRTVMFDLLAAADPAPPVISILREVLRARAVAHPLAVMAEAPRIVAVIHDALNRPEGLFISADHHLPAAAEWLLLAVDNPISQIATAVGVKQPAGLLLAGPDVPWFERDRVVCPAFFLLAD